MKFKKYHKDENYSYTLGFFPTIELIKYKKEEVIKVVYTKKAEKSKAFDELVYMCIDNDIELEQNDIQVDKLAHKDNTFVVGIFKKYETKLEKDQNHIVLFKPSDIGNIGMIIRSSLAFGVSNIAIISPAVDHFNPKVIRASMGAFFNCNIEYFDSFRDYQNNYKNNLYIFDIKGENYLNDIQIKKPFSFLFGTESSGLPDAFLEYGTVTKIPYESTLVESLNLANSVSIALYEAYK